MQGRKGKKKVVPSIEAKGDYAIRSSRLEGFCEKKFYSQAARARFRVHSVAR